jgi:hypothetical protein
MAIEDKFRSFDSVVIRLVLAVLLVLGAIKVIFPAFIEVHQLLLK